MRRGAGHAILLCLLLLSLRAQAAADPVVQARRMCREAEELQRQGDLQKALGLYEHAYELVPTPVILLNKAALYRGLHQPAAGLLALRKIDPEVLPLAKRRELVLLLQQLTAQLIEAPAKAPPPAPDPPARASSSHPANYDPIPVWSALGNKPRTAHRPQVRGLRIAGWALSGAGLLLAIAGATLWAVDGRPTCQPAPGQMECPLLLDTRTTGVALIGIGAAAMGGAAVMIGVDYRGDRNEHHGAMLTLAGKF